MTHHDCVPPRPYPDVGTTGAYELLHSFNILASILWKVLPYSDLQPVNVSGNTEVHGVKSDHCMDNAGSTMAT